MKLPWRRRRSDTSEPEPECDITLMSEYGLDMPLWGAVGSDQEKAATFLGLSAELTRDLLDWQVSFKEHCATLSWDNPANADTYATQGRALLRRLREELPGNTIELDLWPLDPDYITR